MIIESMFKKMSAYIYTSDRSNPHQLDANHTDG